MIVLDPTKYYTRQQSDARYVRLPTPPAPPTNVILVSSGIVITATSETASINITLTIPTDPNLASFNFQVVGAGQTIVVSSVANGIGPYTISGLALNTSYAVSVASVDSYGQISAYTAPITCITPADTNPPSAPTITATPDATGCLITLAALDTAPNFGYYDLLRSVNSDMSGATMLASFGTISYQDIAIPATGNYYYQVQAYTTYGYSSLSNIVGPESLTSTVLPTPPYPDVLSGSTLANANGSITINWPALTWVNLGYWRVWRQINPSGDWVLLSTIPASSGISGTYTDTDTVGGVTYNYTISSIDNEGGTLGYNNSLTLTATALNLSAPNPPTSLEFTAGEGSIIASWTASNSSEVILYAVNYSLSIVPIWQPTDLLVSGTSFTLYGLSQTAASLVSGGANPLTFRVKAVNFELGESTALTGGPSFPDLSAYTPTSSTPIAPDPITVAPNTNGGANISWTAPAGLTNIFGYRLDRLEIGVGLGDWEVIANIQDSTSGIKTFIDTGLQPYSYAGALYRYRVFTIDTTGGISSFNMVINPNFEQILSEGWTGIGTIVNSPVDFSTSALESSYSSGISQTLPVEAGLEYGFSAYVQQGSLPGDTAQIRWQWLDASFVIISQDTATIATIGSYLRLSIGPFPAPVNAAYVVLFLDGDPSSPTTTFYWDAIQFEQSLVITPYANGKSVEIQASGSNGPPSYNNINLAAKGVVNGINLTWNDPPISNTTYVQSVFEVWRASNVAGSPGTFQKIVEVIGNNDNAPNAYEDFNPTQMAETFFYNLKAQDQYGNESGFLTGPVTATSQTIDLDDIPSGNTYVKIIGVSSTNQVTTASLTPQSVSFAAQTVTVGPKAVTTALTELASLGIITNGGFVLLDITLSAQCSDASNPTIVQFLLYQGDSSGFLVASTDYIYLPYLGPNPAVTSVTLIGTDASPATNQIYTLYAQVITGYWAGMTANVDNIVFRLVNLRA